MTRPAWIAFDAVGTLICPHPPVAAVYARVAGKYGSRRNESEIRRRFKSAFADAEAADLDAAGDWSQPECLTTSEEQERERWRRIVSRVLDDVTDPARCFEELFDYFARASAWACYEDVEDTLRTLAALGLQMVVATNFDRRFECLRAGLPPLAPIGRCVISSVVGYRKPSRHFFDGLCRELDCRPPDVLLVGDDEVNDVAGGRAAGLHVLKLDRQGQDPSANTISTLYELCLRLRK